MRPGGPGGPGGRRGGPPGMMPGEKPKNLRATLSRILTYIGKNRRLIIAMLAVMLVATLLNVIAPTIQANAIDSIAKLDANALVTWLVVLGAVYLCSAVFTYFQNLFAAMLSQYTVRVMRKDLFARISRLPIKYMDTHKHGDILSRMTNDVENVSNSVSQSLGSLISGVIMLIGCFVMMLIHSWLMTIVSMVTIVLTLLVTKFLSKFMRKYFPLQQAKLGQLNGQIEEAVSGCKTVKAFTHEGKICEDFNQTSDELKTVGIKAQILGGVMGPCMNTIGNFGFLLIAVVGAVLASRPETDMFYISIGTIQAFITYSKQFTRPINEIANQYAQIQSALAGAERVFDVMDSEPEDQGGNEPFEIENVKGDLNFKDIDFSYVKGEQVLKHFDLWVKSGQKIAIVGATGSGKTTVVNLLTRFYDIDGGVITLDGQDIRNIRMEDLREEIGFVPQKGVLFSGTIASNLRFGKRDATDEQIKEAAAIAQAADFIEEKQEKYDSDIAQGGSNVSGGQKQRLAIARAIAKQPKIYVFDDSFSALDLKTDAALRKALASKVKDSTVIIVAQRISTILHAEQILVLDDGKIVGKGTHEELLKNCETYQQIARSQLSAKELGIEESEVSVNE